MQEPAQSVVVDRVFKNWKTTTQSLLIAVLGIAVAMNKQGITLGHVGTGSVVTLISSIGVVLLGAISKDK